MPRLNDSERVIVTITDKDIERNAVEIGLDVDAMKEKGQWEDFMTRVTDRARSDFNLSTASDDLESIVSKAADAISCELGYVNIDECEEE